MTVTKLRSAAASDSFEEIDAPIYFASAEHLIAMKEHAGRDVDRGDVTALRRALGLEDD